MLPMHQLMRKMEIKAALECNSSPASKPFAEALQPHHGEQHPPQHQAHQLKHQQLRQQLDQAAALLGIPQQRPVLPQPPCGEPAAAFQRADGPGSTACATTQQPSTHPQQPSTHQPHGSPGNGCTDASRERAFPADRAHCAPQRMHALQHSGCQASPSTPAVHTASLHSIGAHTQLCTPAAGAVSDAAAPAGVGAYAVLLAQLQAEGAGCPEGPTARSLLTEAAASSGAPMPEDDCPADYQPATALLGGAAAAAWDQPYGSQLGSSPGHTAANLFATTPGSTYVAAIAGRATPQQSPPAAGASGVAAAAVAAAKAVAEVRSQRGETAAA